MPGDSEHPVTVGDLRVVTNEDPASPNEAWWGFATVADLVSALRAEGYLVIEKVGGEWPKWARDVLHYDVAALAECTEIEILDALAEAQPFPPAGEPPKDPWDYDP